MKSILQNCNMPILYNVFYTYQPLEIEDAASREREAKFSPGPNEGRITSFSLDI